VTSVPNAMAKLRRTLGIFDIQDAIGVPKVFALPATALTTRSSRQSVVTAGSTAAMASKRGENSTGVVHLERSRHHISARKGGVSLDLRNNVGSASLPSPLPVAVGFRRLGATTGPKTGAKQIPRPLLERWSIHHRRRQRPGALTWARNQVPPRTSG